LTAFVCVTCGTQFPESEEPPEACPICLDPRQYVPEDGQRWTTMADLRAAHRTEVRADGELDGVGCEPGFAIGQRALLVPFGEQRLMWDCITLVDEAGADAVEARGGLAGIAISHPHYYSAMVEWAHRFDCPVHLHANDREWIMRPDSAIELWSGEFLKLGTASRWCAAAGTSPAGRSSTGPAAPRAADRCSAATSCRSSRTARTSGSCTPTPT